MAHFALLWKARTIEKYRQNYENEKINSIIMSNAAFPEKTLFHRWRHYSHDLQKRLSRKFSKWYPEGTTVSNFFVNLRGEMKLPHILLRSLFGFIGGLMLTYLGFMFFVFQLSLSLILATVLSSIVGVLLTLGLTFSNRTRCLVFLLVPQLFSRVGRYTLTCYALVLILTGPATNTLKNSEVLTESMACSQEHIKTNVRQINESINKPCNAVKDSLRIIIDTMKQITRKLKSALVKINRLALSIASLIQSGFQWLDSVAKICNHRLGSPYKRCISILKKNVNNCKAHDEDNEIMETHNNVRHNRGHRKCIERSNRDIRNSLDEDFKLAEDQKKNERDSQERESELPWFCNAEYVAETVWATLKAYDRYCVPADFADETLLATIRKRLQTFSQRFKALLHVQLKIRHTYTFIRNSSSNSQIAAGIVTEIRNRADPILTWLSWSSCVTSLFLLLIIFRAKHYQHMFETRSRFDNRFITKEFRELDLKRLREGRETALPLNRRERAKYVTTTSFRLVASEQVHLNRSAVFMTITTFKLLIHIVADYSLYWVLMTIRHHGELQTHMKPGWPSLGACISGSGFVERLLQSFVETMNIELFLPVPSHADCLPKPHAPDVKRYYSIGFLIFLLWFFALFEPYGLRLRHLIMGNYRPERAKARAIWLYSHILRTRGSFMKFARRKLHREYKYSSESKLTFRHWLRSHIPFSCLRSLLGIEGRELQCLLCGITSGPNESHAQLIKCAVKDCLGAYCVSCFSDIGQMCTICMSPSDYGDLSDDSLEKGSSDEDDRHDDNSDDKGNGSNSAQRTQPDQHLEKPNSSSKDSSPRESRAVKRKGVSSFFEKYEDLDSETYPLQSFEMEISARNEVKFVRCDFAEGRKYILLNKSKRFILESVGEPNCYKTITTSKDKTNNYLITQNVLTQFKLLQYGVYTIIINRPFSITKDESTTQFAKYLRRKKIIRCKKKLYEYPCKLFLSCNNEMKEGTSKDNGIKLHDSKNITIFSNLPKRKNVVRFKKKRFNKSETKYFMTCNEKTNEETNKVNKNEEQITYPKNNPKKDMDRKKCKDNNSENKPLKSGNIDKRNEKVRSNDSKLSAKKCSNVFGFKYWKKTFTVLRCSALKTNTKNDLPPIDEKKHKKKKKSNRPRDKVMANDEATRNWRILTYLDEQNWTNSKFDDDLKLKNDLVHNIKQQTPLEVHALPKEDNEAELFDNIPRLNLDFLSDSIADENGDKKDIAAEEIYSTRNRDFARCAIDRFFKSISCHSDITSSVSISESNKRLKGINFSGLFKRKFMSYSSILKADKKGSEFNDHYSHEDITMSKIKRVISEGFSSFGFRRPLSILKELYASIFADEDTVERKNEQVVIKTVDKTVSAFPSMDSFACQNNLSVQRFKDRSIQVTLIAPPREPSIKNVCDAPVNATRETCTCATQYKIKCKDACTNGLDMPPQICRCYNCAKRSPSSSSTCSSEYSISTIRSVPSSCTEDTKTDTTVCSFTNTNYRKDAKAKIKKLKVKVVTKANRSTLTDSARVCDVSTSTYDWWSPIVEKKELRVEKKNEIHADKNKVIPLERKRRPMLKLGKISLNKGISTDGRIVKFRSRAQIIPNRESGLLDILSPSRYLLESQKYYNELFSTKYSHPNYIYSVAHVQKPQSLGKVSPQVSIRQHSRRSRKTSVIHQENRQNQKK